jgi:hypothetical protein
MKDYNKPMRAGLDSYAKAYDKHIGAPRPKGYIKRLLELNRTAQNLDDSRPERKAIIKNIY